jgi:predicted RNase H-like nuclease (RuvC/YqgF family)|tara:strand:- start:2015 stop:2353 length:339 start_codon:yes stop_codon:yes gene_type:complete
MAVTEESKLAKKVEEQTSEIKFTEDELKALSDLNTGYTTKQTQFGQLRVQRILVNQQLENLDETEIRLETEYKELQKSEQDLVKQLNDKYGPGQLDPNTGVFTPTASETAEQ